MTSRDSAAFQALLRKTLQGLGQLQERKHSQHQITRRDIATLLHGGNVGLARTKAQNVVQDDKMGDLLEVLEMCVGTVLEHISELGGGRNFTPAVIEAASSIVYAAPSTESRDLNMIRDTLIQRLGRAFAHSASTNGEKTVFPGVIEILSSPAPTAATIDEYLVKIADAYGVKWSPELGRQDIVGFLSEILDPNSSPVIDLARLRKLCSHGLPDNPPWIRPRIWRLLLEILPASKSTWERDNCERRENYYDLVQRLLIPLGSLPPPSTPLSHTDATILKVSESLFRLPLELFSGLGGEPESNGLCPFDEAAQDTITIGCAHNLDLRLQFIQKESAEPATSGIPEIRLAEPTEASIPDSPSPSEGTHTTLLQANPSSAPPVHRKHLSALLRLLYLHACLNPANQVPHTPALLVPLYSALMGEVEPADAAHAEADTFWLFEALVGELVELEDEEGGRVWARSFSEKLATVDGELAMNLHVKGLDPALPHYSSRWLATLLTQTLPLSAIFPVWDVILACPTRTRGSSPKLTRLVDICVSLLVQARIPLLQLGRSGHKAAGLWNQEAPSVSSLRPWELSDAFMEGMALLQTYPIDAVGGIDRVLQTASAISSKAVGEVKVQKTDGLTLGARLKATVWKGFASPLTVLTSDGQEESSEDEEAEGESEHDGGNDTETPAAQSLTSRLANTVWRGITNQSSMEDEIPSPQSPPRSPSPPTPRDDAKKAETRPVQATMWNYAGKLKDSDTVAAFSKVSTNWRARAMDAWSSRRGSNASTMDAQSPRSVSSEFPPSKGYWPGVSGPEYSPGSVSNAGSENSADPALPTFLSPRESFFLQPRRQPVSAPPSPDISPGPNGTFIDKTKISLASLASQIRPAPPAKGAPRPLLLSSRSVIASMPHSPPRSGSGTTPPPGQEKWSDVLSRGRETRQGSISSTSSLSRQEVLSRRYPYSTGSRSDCDSDGGSRRVPLNRKSISPMALASGSSRPSWAIPPLAHSSDASLSSGRGRARVNRSDEASSERGCRLVDTTSSLPGPPTPLHAPGTTRVCVNGIDRAPTVAGGCGGVPLVLGPPARGVAIVRKRTPPPVRRQSEGGDASDSSLSLTPSASSKSPRLRTKRYVTRPASLQIVESHKHVGQGAGSLLVPEPAEEQELTPRAGDFGGSDPSSGSMMVSVSSRGSPTRKTSGDGSETHVRARKVSTNGKEVKRTKDGNAEEGDDEGYDELLSAYESEE